MVNSTIEYVDELKSQSKIVLVDYWAPWCIPCKSLIGVLETIQPDYPNVTFIKIDISNIVSQVVDMGITSIPTVIIYNGESTYSTTVGVQTETYYRNELDGLIET